MAKQIASLLIELRGTTAKLQEDMAKSVGILQGAEKKIGAVMGNVQKTIQAALVVGGIVAVKKLSDALVDLAEKGEAAGSIADGFKSLGGSSAQIELANKAVLGMVDSFDLMQIANSGLLKQIPGFNEHFAQIAELGGRVANTLGIDTKQAIQQVTDAIASGKPKLLEQVGIIVDTDKAYSSFANKIGVASDKLSDAQKKASIQIAAQNQLESSTKRLAPITDSVANAHAAFGVALGEAAKQAGISVNNNEQLTKAWRTLEDAVKKIDWLKLGEEAANVGAILLDIASRVLPLLVDLLNNAGRGFDYLFGASTQANADRLATKISDLKDQIKDLNEAQRKTNPEGSPLYDPAQTTRELDALNAQLKPLQEEFDQLGAKLNEATVKNVESYVTLSKIPAELSAKSAEAIKEQTRLNDELNKKLSTSSAEAIKQEFEKALKLGNSAAANDYLAKYKAALEVVAEEEVSKFRGVNDAKAEELKTALVEKGYKPALEDALQATKDLHNKSVDEWRSVFEDAFGGAQVSWQDQLKKLAIDFGAELAASVSSGIGDGSEKGVASIGGMLAKAIEGAWSEGTAKGSAAAAGGSGGAAAGQSNTGGYIAAGVSVVGSAFNAHSKDKATGSKQGTGEAVGGAVGAVAGAYIAGAFTLGIGAGAGAVIGAAIGSAIGGAVGSKLGMDIHNPDTLARFKAGSFLQNRSGLNLPGFLNKDRFDGGAGFDSLKKLTNDSRQQFEGLGEGIRDVLGITEEVGPQIAAILSEDLNGNIDKARMLFATLGVSAEEMGAKVMEAGLNAGKSWLEIEGQLEGIDKISQPGLQALGDVKGAFQEIIDSGGKGLGATHAVVAVAIEAVEKGINSFDALKNELNKSFSPEQVNDFFKALAQRGITNFDELKNASTRTAGAIIADMDALGFAFENVAAKIEEATKAVKGMGAATSGVDTSAATKTPALASGGIVSTRTMAMIGEAGPEAVMPLTRINGKLGVRMMGAGSGSAGGQHIYIDARGAAPGTEQKIRAMMRQISEETVARGLNSYARQAGRGGLRGGF